MKMNKDISITATAKIDIDAKVKRGPDSMNYIRFVLMLLIGLTYITINNIPIAWYYKIMIIIIIVIFWGYLCFRCLKFQNIILKIKDKLEDLV